MTADPTNFPPVEQWPTLVGPDCLFCERPDQVRWMGQAVDLDTGADVHVWDCGDCCNPIVTYVTRWPVLDGPECPTCQTPATCWLTIAPDYLGDWWTCEHGHHFVLTPEGLIVLPEEAA